MGEEKLTDDESSESSLSDVYEMTKAVTINGSEVFRRFLNNTSMQTDVWWSKAGKINRKTYVEEVYVWVELMYMCMK